MPETRRLLDLADVGILFQDADARIDYCNEAALRLLGLSRDTLLGRTSYDPRWRVVRPDRTPFPGEEHPAPVAIRTGEPQRDVVMGVFRPEEEDWVWLRVDAIPDRDDRGEVIGCVVSFADISPEIAARMEAEGLYHATLASMSEGVVVHGPDGRIRFANEAAQAALGLTEEQLYGRLPLDPEWTLTRSDGMPLTPEHIPSEITRKTGEPVRSQRIGVRSTPAGGLRWLSVSTDPIGPPDPAGTPVVATFEDVTETLRMQARIDRERDRFTRVADAVPGLVFQLFEPPRNSTDQARYTYLSAQCESVLRVSPEILEEDASYLVRWCIHPEDRPRILDAWRAARRGGGPVEFDFRLRDGPDWAWVRMRAVPHRRGDGIEWHGMALDVTDQYGLADSLRRAQRLQSISRMTAGIAHNFNNALQAILPNLEVALRHADEEVRGPLADAHASARAASDLVGQLLLAARGEGKVATVASDLAPITRSVVSLCRATFGPGVSLRSSIEDDLPVAMARVHIEQILLNLLMNARDATRTAATPTITVELVRHDDEVLLLVEDNGSGMTPETLASLGEPFFTTKGITGHGLGLATVYGIVREHGGTVDVESSLGEGSRFIVTLPCAESVAEPVDPPPPDAEPSALDGALRVLVVDDQPLVSRAAARILSAMGHEVVIADGGEAALEHLDDRLDAALIDLSMPDLSGDRVLTAFREHQPDLRIAIITGHHDVDIDLSAADAVLLKPVDGTRIGAFLSGGD